MIEPNSPMSDLVMVFSRPGCGPCSATKRKLAKLGVEYVEIDLATNEEAVPYLKRAGATEAPVVTYGGSIWTTGFNPDRLEKLAEVIQHPWPEEALEALPMRVIEVRTANLEFSEETWRMFHGLPSESVATEEEAAA